MFETILFNAVKALSSGFEMVFAFILLSRFFEKKYENPWGQRIAFLLSAGTVFVLQEVGYAGEIKVIAEILWILLISFVLYDGKKRDRVVFLFAFSILLALSDIVSAFVLSWVRERAPFLTGDSFFFRLLNFELPYLIELAAVLLLSVFIRRKSEHIAFRYWMLLLAVPAIAIVTLTVFQFALESIPDNREVHTYIYISAAGLLFITVLVFALFSKLQNQLTVSRDNREMKMQLELQQQSAEKMENAYNHTRALRHDLKNHLRALDGMLRNGSTDDALAYIQTMQSDLEDATYFAVTGNTAIDAILNEKLLTAQRQETNLRFDTVSLKKTKVKSMDLCIILSNALDNALEACQKLSDVQARTVSLKIREESDFLLLSVQNPVTEPPKKLGNSFLSDKKDRENHGIGLRSIRSTAEKYSGEVLAQCENNVFTLLVKLYF